MPEVLEAGTGQSSRIAARNPRAHPPPASLLPSRRCGFHNLRRVISEPFIMQLRSCIASIRRGGCWWGWEGVGRAEAEGVERASNKDKYGAG